MGYRSDSIAVSRAMGPLSEGQISKKISNISENELPCPFGVHVIFHALTVHTPPK